MAPIRKTSKQAFHFEEVPDLHPTTPRMTISRSALQMGDLRQEKLARRSEKYVLMVHLFALKLMYTWNIEVPGFIWERNASLDLRTGVGLKAP